MMNMAGDTHGNNISKKCTIIVSVRQSQGNGYMILILFFQIMVLDYIWHHVQSRKRKYILAKERFHVHERIWSDEKSWEDPDYPFDWTEGEFC